MDRIGKIGLGGGCHWCTEAVFEQLKGIIQVKQGYIASEGLNNSFSEAVIVEYEPAMITPAQLIAIYLRTHASTSEHSFRDRYRSAIYFFKKGDNIVFGKILKKEQDFFAEIIITQILAFKKFKASRKSLLHYYENNREAPFCTRYIDPKLNTLSTSHKHLLKATS